MTQMMICPKHGPLFNATACPVKGCLAGRQVALKLPGLDGGRQSKSVTCAREDVEQELLFNLCRRFQRQYWELGQVFAIPNGAWVANEAQAKKLLRTGLLPGVSDIFCPIPRQGYHGFWIEMKRLRGTRPTPEQLEWLDSMRWLGYRAEWIRGGWAAWRALSDYLDIPLDSQGLPTART